MLALAAAWAPVALYLGVISYFSHQPSLPVPGGLPDWLMHAMEYAVLALLVARAAARTASRGRVFGRAAWLAGAAGCALFGMVDEYHQSFVPGRDASLRDVAADAAGAALALGAAGLVRSRLAREGAHAGPGATVITIYGRRECHLCDEAGEVIRKVAEEFPAKIVHVDVDSDPGLQGLYGEQVPVVTINGRKLFKYRVDPARLRAKLASLQQRSRI